MARFVVTEIRSCGEYCVKYRVRTIPFDMPNRYPQLKGGCRRNLVLDCYLIVEKREIYWCHRRIIGPLKPES